MPVYSKRAPHLLCRRNAEFRPHEVCLLLPTAFINTQINGGAWLPASTPGQSRVTSCGQGSTAHRQPAAMGYRCWSALLNQGRVLKTISLTWSRSCFGLRVVWHWLCCSWFLNGWSYTRQTAWPEWTEATHFNSTGLKASFNKAQAVSAHKPHLAFGGLQPSI